MASPFVDLQTRAREELTAAWQALLAQASPAVEKLLGERFLDADKIHQKEIQKEVLRAERGLCERLNQTARRLQRAERLSEWAAALREAAAAFSSKTEVFPKDPANWKNIPAFTTVIETQDTVVTLKDAGQLSAAVLDQVGTTEATRCYLIPVFGEGHLDAILYAEPGKGFDRNGLELLAALAWGTMPEPEAAALPAGQVNLKGMTGDERPVPETDLSQHVAAQRFARVRVAELLLHQRERVESGRRERRLYVHLKDAIDANRREFRDRFVDRCASMADYFDQELVHTLAHDEAETMGREYPGAVV